MKTNAEVVYRVGDRVQSTICLKLYPHEYGHIVAIDDEQVYASILWDKDKHKKKPKSEVCPLKFVRKFEDDAWSQSHFGEDPPNKTEAKWEDKYQSVNKREVEKNESEQAPEIFLEETVSEEPQPKPRKSRYKRGCLYQYLENKRLKTGEIVSYPRVIEHRDKDNPKHWRWGFNWEEKIDGVWKGRSIGSVPIGALTMIQKMQRSGVDIWEIISFIKRSKSKK